MSTPAGLSAKPCVDAIVAGDGYEVWIGKRWKGAVWHWRLARLNSGSAAM